MRLSEIQSRMAHALLRPLDKTWAMDRSGGSAQDAELYIRPNRRLTAFERLEIYNQSYWYRLLDALLEDFPGLCAITGRKRFTELSVAYLTECPSRSFTLRNLGLRLPRWLARNPEWVAPAPRLALDMAQLEWADVVAFDGAERPPVTPQTVLAQGAGARFGLQPHLTLLEVSWPVDELRLAINALSEDQFARARVLARQVARKPPERRVVAVYRYEQSVYYRRLEADEFRVLRKLGRGVTLGEALVGAPRRGQELEPELVRQWFAAWARLGWLTARD